MKRFFLVLAVGALIAAMMAVSAMPAFALRGQPGPPKPPPLISKAVENACDKNVSLSFCG